MQNSLKRAWDTYESVVVRNIWGDREKHAHTRAHLNSASSKSRFNIFVTFSMVLCLCISSWLLNKAFLSTEESLAIFDYFSYLLIYTSLLLVSSVTLLMVKNIYLKGRNYGKDYLLTITFNTFITSFSLLYSPQAKLFLVFTVAVCLLLLTLKFIFKVYSVEGLNFYLSTYLGIAMGLIWGYLFLKNMNASTTTKFLILCAAPLLLVAIPSGFINMLELYDVVCREKWRRMRHSYSHKLKTREAFVSIQVPTYSEPPEVVIGTIDKLALTNYHQYEVIVIDNNTKDSSLWLPVKKHCEELGPKFRFMHVDDLQGAKGGALNYVTQFSDPRTEIIAVVDADYQVEKDFLIELVGHFDNPKVGFIQTPHDYREWQHNLFLSMCYWEYKVFFHSTMISLNERDAGITVGTMCLVRKDALLEAGGWSEWCVTEDSELAIRIHDKGYSSIYVDKTYGQGLIPDSFEGYKKQRYRWTAGPVQEFRHHSKHFLGLSKKESKFSFIQRIFHLNHGLSNVLLGFRTPLMIICLAIISSMIIHGEIIAVPFELWLVATITLVVAPMLSILLYRVTVRANFRDIIGQGIAAKALSHTIHQAAFRTSLKVIAARNRTSKFKSHQS